MTRDIRLKPGSGKPADRVGKAGAAMRHLVAGALALGMVAMAAGAEERGYKGYELPPYTVKAVDGVREVRAYGPHLLAEVTVAGSRGQAIQTGFRALAGYIFGGNAQDEKIAMTVPVAQTPEGGNWVISFMMPAGFTPDTLPAPRDGRIRLVQAGPSRQVVERFPGLPGTRDLEERAAALRTWAEGQGMVVTAGPHYYFYDGPMTLPWRRRNEVAFTIR